MYTEPTHFETALLKKSGRWNLAKSDYDLFLIAQANTITYEQLSYTGIHGPSGVGDRLSLKKLEKNMLITSKLWEGKKKFYLLTSKGKECVKKIFGEDLLSDLEIDLDRKPPTGNQQLFHRIHTNDLYYHYLSFPFATPPVWNIEQPYVKREKGENLPRCDAELIVDSMHYYIEQDNGTQSELLLETKLKQYLSAHFFQSHEYNSHQLVFTLQGQAKRKDRTEKAPYTLYRILLKTCKVWQLVNQTQPVAFLEDLLKQIKDSSSSVLLSKNEIRLLRMLKEKHGPALTLSQLQQLKTDYCHDTTRAEESQALLDLAFKKRILKFLHLAHSIPQLHSHLLQGMQFFLIPNHRIKEQIPFLMPYAYPLKTCFLQALFYAGLDYNTWTYHANKQIAIHPNLQLPFRHIFLDRHKHGLLFLDVMNHLGDRIQFCYLLKYTCQNLTIICMVNTCNDASQLTEEYALYGNRNTILFVNKPSLLNGTSHFYTVQKDPNDNYQTISKFLDYDNQLILSEGVAHETN